MCFIFCDNGKSSIHISDVAHEDRDWAVGGELGTVTAMQDLCCTKSYVMMGGNVDTLD